MATLDHYKNGYWVGSTDVPGNLGYSGWVHTYKGDGNSYDTMIHNDPFAGPDASGNETPVQSSSGGGGFGITDAIQDGVFVATIALILVLALLPLSPVWYFLSKNKIKEAIRSGNQPHKLLIAANKIAKFVCVLQIISLVVAILLGIAQLVLFIPQLAA